MAELNFFKSNVNASGQMLWVVCDALSRTDAMSMDDLSAHLQPHPFIEAGTKGTGTTKRSAPWLALTQSVNVGVGIGVLESRGRRGDLRFSLKVSHDVVEDADLFRTAIRRAILNGTKDDDGSVVYGDLPLALAWIMGSRVEDSFFFSHANGPEKRLRSHGVGAELIQNSSQWRPFIRWAEFLGLVTIYGNTRIGRLGVPVVPDPRTAILDEVANFPKKLNGVEFARRLTEQIPIFTGGAIFASLLASDVTLETEINDGRRFTPVTSHAILSLAESGRFLLKKKDDDSNRIILTGASGSVIVDEVTHG